MSTFVRVCVWGGIEGGAYGTVFFSRRICPSAAIKKNSIFHIHTHNPLCTESQTGVQSLPSRNYFMDANNSFPQPSEILVMILFSLWHSEIYCNNLIYLEEVLSDIESEVEEGLTGYEYLIKFSIKWCIMYTQVFITFVTKLYFYTPLGKTLYILKVLRTLNLQAKCMENLTGKQIVHKTIKCFTKG